LPSSKFGWFLAQAALQVWPPGPTVQGMEQPDGSQFDYRMNEMFSFPSTLGVVAGLWAGGFGLAGRHCPV